ncbi:DMT family transporter [Pseudogracilibacillus auburnensis]|uniref:DMT family transporter n=1 Tax=Pseudogracilibacillus auburnensis TaxID=1494959 RepID=UPI001F60C0C8|nr:DMT family transporter [Pseudogracilibacillus auburnensis]
MLFLVMAIWGFNLSALVILVNNIEPITLTSVRIFVAGISVLIISKIIGIFRLPTRQEWKTIFIITIFNVAFHHTLLAIGLTSTSGVNAGIILGAAPLVTMVLSIILLHDKVSRLRAVGFIFGFIGIMITSLAGAEGLSSISYGDLMIFLSMLMQAFSFILISKLNPTFDPRLLTGYMLVLGSGFIFIVSLIVEGNVTQLTKLFSFKLGIIFLFSAIMATAFGHMTYNYAIKNVGPTETTIFVNLNTLFALLGTAIFLGEPILRNHYFGLVFILLGIFIGSGTLEYVLRKRRLRS